MALKKRSGQEGFLVTDISPLFSEEGEKAINECFREEMAKADRVEISVAFCAGDSLQEVDDSVKKEKIQNICLILGMYYFIGLNPKLHTVVVKMNDEWKKKGIGEKRLVNYFPHHGKLYCFYKNDRLFSAIIGSPNLSFLKKPRQYEIAQLVHEHSWLMNYQKHIKKLKSYRFSKNVADLEQYKSIDTKEIIVNGKAKEITKITYTKKLLARW
ncbi:restriction endonuclease PLD domain-containing protein [Mycoplasma wenyonii]|uniref:restriction endonuclease PLD domain-containing protein n=1 Tax=Mycoplasma wenyonii TaxID=65123 RepID=UPI0002F06305|nr:restriction endonuclease PLD domain-containing protein [Mycoplasma wenyonii]